ncbi:MAG: inorganic phosphate transporter [Armatimonadetes bacterium]|nr:inorganic phosphate transporter [Armatimonadota bacterium]
MHEIYIVFIILTALVFDFVNGFHDSANSIATIVSTRVLSPKLAVLWAAFFNFAAAFLFGTAVAKTIGKGMVKIEVIDSHIILAGLIGAILWDLITWYLALPTSSSHALIGGYAGAAIAKAGFSAVIFSGWKKVLIFIVVAPLIGLILAFIFVIINYWIFNKFSPHKIDKYFRKLQLFSAALYSLGHGTNDAQKTMGIIAGLLFVNGYLDKFYIPFWVQILCYLFIAFGTMAGGWRIVRTMGSKITKLKPIDGFCAESAGAFSLFLSTHLGIPVSTTHVITGAISGVGAVQRLSAVRWGITLRIVWAWILTIPFSAIIAAFSYRLLIMLKSLIF